MFLKSMIMIKYNLNLHFKSGQLHHDLKTILVVIFLSIFDKLLTYGTGFQSCKVSENLLIFYCYCLEPRR